MSFVSAFFESSVFKSHVKAQEAEQKVVVALFARMDAILKAFGYLGRAIAKAIDAGRRR